MYMHAPTPEHIRVKVCCRRTTSMCVWMEIWLAHRAISASGLRALVTRMSLQSHQKSMSIFWAVVQPQYGSTIPCTYTGICAVHATDHGSGGRPDSCHTAPTWCSSSFRRQATQNGLSQFDVSSLCLLTAHQYSENQVPAHRMHCPGSEIGQPCCCHQSPPDAEKYHSARPSRSISWFHHP